MLPFERKSEDDWEWFSHWAGKTFFISTSKKCLRSPSVMTGNFSSFEKSVPHYENFTVRGTMN
jgi:hypothetical protein